MSRHPVPVMVEPIFDRTPQPFADGPPDPIVYDASEAALRQRTVNFAAKRLADMMFITGLDRATAERHFRWRAVTPPAGLSGRAPAENGQAALAAAQHAGHLRFEVDAADHRATVIWHDPSFAAPVIGAAISRRGYGTILLGPHAVPMFDPRPIERADAAGRAWPHGSAVDGHPAAPPALAAALDAFFAACSGVYGVLIARPDRVLLERYNAFDAPDRDSTSGAPFRGTTSGAPFRDTTSGAPFRATPSWSMTKAISCTLIGRMIHDGWLGSVYDPAPAPLWRDPRDAHHLITLDHLLRMRSGLAFPVMHDDGRVSLGFENSAVYQDAADAFDVAQRCIVATVPGSVFRYINSGVNVLGAIIRDQIMRRGLPYHATVYGLLADRIGMHSYQHSADIVGNFIASGAGYATLRDYAKLGVLYLQDGVWGGERLLPEGWADYALAPTHAGTSYAACFRSNSDRLFPDLPEDTAWASGASDQRIFILRRHRLTVAVANETDHKMDLAALNRVIATAIDVFA